MLQFQQNINKLSEDELNAKFEQMLVRIYAMCFLSVCMRMLVCMGVYEM